MAKKVSKQELQQHLQTVKRLEDRKQYFQSLISTLDGGLMAISTAHVIELTDEHVNKIIMRKVQINHKKDIQSFIEQEQMKQKKAELEKFRFRENIHLNEDLEQKVLEKDLIEQVKREILEEEKVTKVDETTEEYQQKIRDAMQKIKKFQEAKKVRERRKMEA